MKPLQQYFHMVLFISYVVLTFDSLDQILWCDHSNEISLEVLSCGVIFFKKILQNEIWDFCRICLWSYLEVKGLK